MRYRIEGETLPVVICDLEQGEGMLSESGSMAWMSPNMKMETTSNGGLKKALGRMFTGEKIFQNRYTAENGAGMIAFASSFPGSIKAFEITPGNEIIMQKNSFLAAEKGIELSVFLNKKLGAGFFGGEGFIMQRISGNGIAFAEFDGHIVKYDLNQGEKLVVDTGHLAAMTGSCQMDIQRVKGAKNIFFGGEGLFLTTVTGPGSVWLQTMPLVNVANALIPFMPQKTEIKLGSD
ncbi:MAG: TIGR00266 family protein [Candidatus Ornithomonoglobus sp.]